MNIFSTYLYTLLAIVIGFSLVSQAGVNSQLRTSLSSPIQSAFISFLIGTIILGTICLFQSHAWFSKHSVSSIPWWVWLGGAFGAFNISMSIFLVPKIGALTLAVSIVCGQVIASTLFDHNGWLGYPKVELTPNRLIGAFIIVVGVFLVSKK